MTLPGPPCPACRGFALRLIHADASLLPAWDRRLQAQVTEADPLSNGSPPRGSPMLTRGDFSDGISGGHCIASFMRRALADDDSRHFTTSFPRFAAVAACPGADRPAPRSGLVVAPYHPGLPMRSRRVASAV